MQIRIRETGAVMYENEFRALHPNTSFPPQLTLDIINYFGADTVLEGAQAQPTRYQVAYSDGVEQDSLGNWVTKYSVTDLDADAIAAKDIEQAKSVRSTRNDKLKECDWTQISDATVDKAAWATYRQALRDVTAQTGFPWDIIWPNDPNYVGP